MWHPVNVILTKFINTVMLNPERESEQNLDVKLIKSLSNSNLMILMHSDQ